jgi:hypothetical protein
MSCQRLFSKTMPFAPPSNPFWSATPRISPFRKTNPVAGSSVAIPPLRAGSPDGWRPASTTTSSKISFGPQAVSTNPNAYVLQKPDAGRVPRFSSRTRAIVTFDALTARRPSDGRVPTPRKVSRFDPLSVCAP